MKNGISLIKNKKNFFKERADVVFLHVLWPFSASRDNGQPYLSCDATVVAITV